MPTRERPNILLIHSDQHRFDCVAANGHRQLSTPNLDRLAAEGTNFTHAFTPAAICSPARASLLTGTWPVRHGCLSIPGGETYKPADPELPTWSGLLADTGYRLGYVGKFHQEVAGDPTDHGFADFVHLGSYAEWREGQGLPARKRTNGWFGEPDPQIAPNQSALAWHADRVLELMRRYTADDAPWVLRWDPPEPHLPNIVPEPYNSMYAPESIAPWPGFADELADKPYIHAQQRRTWKVENWTWEDWAPIVGRYLGEISLLDAQVGRLLDELDRLGLAENTLVVYTTDHGDMCGSHGMIDKHYIMYDDVMRVPLIARFPGRFEAGASCDRFVCHELDIAATICAAAGIPAPDTFAGRSLFDIAAGTAEDWEDIYGSWHGGQFGSWSQRMLRTRRWKYVWNCTAEDELYDLQSDPAEIVNRATDPAVADTIHDLRQRLLCWMEKVDDILLNEWTRRQLAEDLSL